MAQEEKKILEKLLEETKTRHLGWQSDGITNGKFCVLNWNGFTLRLSPDTLKISSLDTLDDEAAVANGQLVKEIWLEVKGQYEKSFWCQLYTLKVREILLRLGIPFPKILLDEELQRKIIERVGTLSKWRGNDNGFKSYHAYSIETGLAFVIKNNSSEQDEKESYILEITIQPHGQYPSYSYCDRIEIDGKRGRLNELRKLFNKVKEQYLKSQCAENDSLMAKIAERLHI